ncbi:MAG: antibiotic biosynthesis monooxygenase family protein [Bacteroidota bacterium]
MKAVALVLMTLCLMTNLSAEPVTLITRYEVDKEHQKELHKEIKRYVRLAAHAEDNIMAEGYYEEANPSVLWVIERWDNKQALDKNRKQIKPGQPSLEFYVKDLEPLSKSEWQRQAPKKEEAITIMLFVDCLPGTENNFMSVYHTAMPQFRGEPGVVNYQLSQFVDDNTRFVTYEKFRNEDAFKYHLGFPPIKPVLDYLETSIRQQPFQRGLHRLIMFTH